MDLFIHKHIMKIKKKLRLLVLAFMIGLACILPIPMTFFRKDNLPKNLIEQVDINEDEDESDDIKELF